MIKLLVQVKFLEVQTSIYSIWLTISIVAIWLICKLLDAFPGTVLSELIKDFLRSVMTNQAPKGEDWLARSRRKLDQIKSQLPPRK